jgi:hypothetical protein
MAYVTGVALENSAVRKRRSAFACCSTATVFTERAPQLTHCGNWAGVGCPQFWQIRKARGRFGSVLSLCTLTYFSFRERVKELYPTRRELSWMSHLEKDISRKAAKTQREEGKKREGEELLCTFGLPFFSPSLCVFAALREINLLNFAKSI